GEFTTIADAIDSVVGATEAVFLVSPGDYSEDAAPNLNDNGAVVALLADGGRPSIRANNVANGPTFTVANGATLLLEGIDLKLNGNSHALQANGLVALDRVE